jgi:thiol-disulfide isomerase/thioredoxin
MTKTLRQVLALAAASAFVLFLGLAASAQVPATDDAKSQRISKPGPFVIDGLDTSDLVGFIPDIRVIDLDGLKKILQRDPKDTRPLLVNFWATWCDGCREEFPDLVKIDNDYRAKGLNFLSVTLDEVADKTRAVDFLKEMKATMPVVLLNVNDPEPAIHAVDEKWDGALPATFLYDREGKLVFKYFGKIKPAELRAAIDKEVGKQ